MNSGPGGTGTDGPLPPRAFETLPGPVGRGREENISSSVFGDPAGTLERLPGRTTSFFPFLDAA